MFEYLNIIAFYLVGLLSLAIYFKSVHKRIFKTVPVKIRKNPPITKNLYNR